MNDRLTSRSELLAAETPGSVRSPAGDVGVGEAKRTGLLRSLWAAAIDLVKTQIHLLQVLMRFPGTLIARPSYWRFDTLQALDIAPGVTVGPFTEVIAYSRSPRSTVRGRLILRRDVHIGSSCSLRAAGGVIEIGESSGIAQGVVLVAANHLIVPGTKYLRTCWDEQRTGITIGRNCWIGARCVILPGVTIGDDAVVAAGSVVTRAVPAGELWAGVPARRLKTIR